MPSQRITKLEKENQQLRDELNALKAKLASAEGEFEAPSDPPTGSSRIPYHGHHSQRGKTHPVAVVSKLKCSFPPCGQYGHNENNCQLRIKSDLEKIATECENGYHKPYLHDSLCIWRCQWCKMHLHEDYVNSMYPNEFVRERAKQAASNRKNMRKYTSRACNFQ